MLLESHVNAQALQDPGELFDVFAPPLSPDTPPGAMLVSALISDKYVKGAKEGSWFFVCRPIIIPGIEGEAEKDRMGRYSLGR